MLCPFRKRFWGIFGYRQSLLPALNLSFPQVDINTVLLVAEKVEAGADSATNPLCHAKECRQLTLPAGKGDYWTRVNNLVTQIETRHQVRWKTKYYRIKLVDHRGRTASSFP